MIPTLISSAPTRRQFLTATGAAAGLAIGQRAVAQGHGRGSAKPDVIVIGAGLSGLYAATLLEEQGARVHVLEGRKRVGGRVFTLDDVPGHPEGGGNGIGAGYARVLDMAKRSEVELIPVRQRTEGTQGDTLINLQGKNIAVADWPTSPLNPFPADRRAKLPWTYATELYLKDNPLKPGDDWTDPQFAKWDISLYDFLARRGESEAAMNLALRTAMLYGTNPYDYSLLALFHSFTWGFEQLAFGKEAYAIKGGNQRLPEAMARRLKASMEFDRTITAIATDSGGVAVTCDDGTVRTAKAVVLTVPFSALRHVHFDPVLPALQSEAIDLLGYSTAIQVHFVADRPFWAEDGMPANMWTDGPAGRFAALHYGDDPNQVTSLLAFVNGAQGERLDRMPADAATAEILAFLARVRPSTRGRLRPVKLLSWQRDPFAGGIYSAWKPGQVTRYAKTMAKPHGRIFFAGEHTALLNRGMEGAMESGERAALEATSVI